MPKRPLNFGSDVAHHRVGRRRYDDPCFFLGSFQRVIPFRFPSFLLGV
jgi:hypothetical protein